MNVVVIEERIYILFENYYHLTYLQNEELLLQASALAKKEFQTHTELAMHINSIEKKLVALIEQYVVSEKLGALDGEMLLKLIKST